ncbi:glycosyltransferase involved in cell wall biosynthesis [Streptococcus gallinaceus]|uniref:glycosyltransferase family 2 protein n=1 Tax=Streptococcus gallinaceus TaxID=165758 RepID=UPI0020A133C7|nr:glycosyltransferase family 2 protein [Streptococcus gallinaceus]MCP1639215.1 glycosyltransferase involved in cell wall biosynthesis [Streptococcus gallinaceus]MCP1770141.1 glycosyltransferase involved in cell wall biosynthesis [Streptococcus gallinaceus]
MEVDISVIIPAYNAEKTIEKCIESVLVQTGCSYEMIIVNDGSTDRTPEIIERYKKQYDNIVYISQENKGPAIARNVALDKVSGKHILFLDSDDFLTVDAFAILSSYIGKDLVILGFQHVKNEEIVKKYRFDRTQQINLRDLFEEYRYLSYLNPSCTRLFKASLIKKYNIEFVSEDVIGGSFGEDTIFNYSYYKNILNCYVDSSIIYNVNLTENSLSRTYKKNTFQPMLYSLKLSQELSLSTKGKSLTFLKLLKNFVLNEIGTGVNSLIIIAEIKEFHQQSQSFLVSDTSLYNRLLVFFLNRRFYFMSYFVLKIAFWRLKNMRSKSA